MLSDLSLRDPFYLDAVYHLLTHFSNKHESVQLWADQTFRKALIDNERALYQAATVKRPLEPSEEQYVTQAMRKWQRNVHVVIMVEELQTYFEGVGLFPGLEALCEFVYMDEMSNEGFKVATQAFFEEKASDNSIFNDQKLTSAMVELRQLVKNQVLQCFYSPQMLKHISSDDYMTFSVTEFIMTTDQKLNGYLYSDGNFTVGDPSHRQYAYNLPQTMHSLPPFTRYMQFLTLFRTLYDYIALSLLVRRTYFEAFLRKSGEFASFFTDIKHTKKSLYDDNFQVTLRVASLRDKIAKLKLTIKEREVILAKKRDEAREVEAEMGVNQAQIDEAMGERDRTMDALMEHVEKITGSEFNTVVNGRMLGEKELRLLEMVSVVIDRNGDVEGFNRKDHSQFFSER